KRARRREARARCRRASFALSSRAMRSAAAARDDDDDDARARFRAGVLSSVGAFAMWGLLPLYVKAVRDVTPLEGLVHRTVWAFVVVVAVLGVHRRLRAVVAGWRSRRAVASFTASAALLSVNWFVFVWAVANGHTVDASLGYFINPLVSIALGALLL